VDCQQRLTCRARPCSALRSAGLEALLSRCQALLPAFTPDGLVSLVVSRRGARGRRAQQGVLSWLFGHRGSQRPLTRVS
jgi:hypothetical protein